MVLFVRVSSGPKTPPGVVVFRIVGLADAVPRSAGKPLIGRNSRPPRPPTNHPSGWFGSVGEVHSLVRNVPNGVSSTLHGTCRVAALRAFQMRDLSLIRASRGVPPGERRDAPGPDPWGAGPSLLRTSWSPCGPAGMVIGCHQWHLWADLQICDGRC